ncbi:hypothetical protein D3H55_02990 [Bacillus salacetis]|uniref:Uncharacterized protein n=1 Tax=Bacillus salacetis TaxID=2315464 RepID=A0A3A1R7R9_9BACI|nr:hypothetical protein [Bacillus salacetis]RIW38517.1 hypothetical protein D3H55_02990 [Bacillus salacetis]
MKKFALILLILFLLSELHIDNAFGKTAPVIDYRIDTIPWEEVDELLPRNSLFTVIDVESGKSFRVQRRAGSSHADVQPLTHRDTKIMKEIYSGSWSWKRRAILVHSENHLIAGSMHGMPHGAGALQNGFPGHFCIHFKGSTTHKTHSPDFSHQLMILKAGGKLDTFLSGLQPQTLVEAFLAGVKNGDLDLVRKTLTVHQTDLKVFEEIETIKWRISSDKSTEASSLVREVRTDLQVFLKERGPLSAKVTFTVAKASPSSPWKVDGTPLLTILNQN